MDFSLLEGMKSGSGRAIDLVAVGGIWWCVVVCVVDCVERDEKTFFGILHLDPHPHNPTSTYVQRPDLDELSISNTEMLNHAHVPKGVRTSGLREKGRERKGGREKERKREREKERKREREKERKREREKREKERKREREGYFFVIILFLFFCFFRFLSLS